MPPDNVDYRPVLRASLMALDRWVKDGAPPPASRYPRMADGTLVESIAPARNIPGFTLAKGPNPRFGSTTVLTSARALSTKPCRSR